MPSISPKEAFTRFGNDHNVVLVDVREAGEYQEGHAQGAISLPLSAFTQATIEKLKSYAQVYVICQSGGRSVRAVEFLNKGGVSAINVSGGTQAWHHEQLPMSR